MRPADADLLERAAAPVLSRLWDEAERLDLPADELAEHVTAQVRERLGHHQTFPSFDGAGRPIRVTVPTEVRS